MPYEVSQLLKDLRDPVTAAPDEPIHYALDRMLDKQFSQLPVVKDNGRFYFITHESILLALYSFGCKIGDSGLQVNDALVKIPNAYRPGDDLFDLLAGMRDMNAAVIVDDNRNLTHVVTTYDTTQYFRQMAEDIMQVRDVEHRLKRIINSAFKKADGEIDEQARRAAVEEIISSRKDLRKKFETALQRYLAQQSSIGIALRTDLADQAFLELLGGLQEASQTSDRDANSDANDPLVQAGAAEALLVAGQNLRERFESSVRCYLTGQAGDFRLDGNLVEDAFRLIYDRNEKLKEFSELTLNEYIQLFFQDGCWQRCQDVFKLKEEEVRHMLDGVRETRNELAHFREEKITAQKRQQLKSCADWLSERENLIMAAFEESAPQVETPAEAQEHE